MEFRQHPTKTSSGLTLIEIMVALSILGILTVLAIPSFQTIIENNRLKSASEEIYNDFRFAFSEAIRSQSNIYISFKPTGAAWCYGIDDVGECNCHIPNDCQIQGVEKVLAAADFQDIGLASSNFTSGTGATKYALFDGVLGTVQDSGTISLSISGKSIDVSLSIIGRPVMCSDDIPGYDAC